MSIAPQQQKSDAVGTQQKPRRYFTTQVHMIVISNFHKESR